MKGKKVIYDDVDMELYIDEDDLNKEITDQPLKFRKWSELANEAEKAVKAIQNELDLVCAEVRLEIIEDYELKGAKRPTTDDLRALVMVSEKVIEIKRELMEAENTSENLKSVVRAFYQRHEMLKDLSANIRKDVY